MYPIIQRNPYATSDEDEYHVALGEDGKLARMGRSVRFTAVRSASLEWHAQLSALRGRAHVVQRARRVHPRRGGSRGHPDADSVPARGEGDDREFQRLQEEMTLFGRPSDPSVLLTNGNVEGKFETRDPVGCGRRRPQDLAPSDRARDRAIRAVVHAGR